MTLYDSNVVFNRVGELAECLCAQIQDPDNGVPDVCFCGITPGDQAVADYSGDCKDKCGMAWVRLASAYPMSGVGTPDISPGNCGTGLGIDVEIGILRCIDIGDATTGAQPTPAELLQTTQLQYADLLVMRKAVYCCDAIPSKDVLLTAYTPVGPLGGLVGGTWTLTMGTE